MGIAEQIYEERDAFPWSTEREVATFLADLAGMTGRVCALELGTFRGATAAKLAEACRSVTTVDVSDQRSPIFKEKFSGLFICGDSRTFTTVQLYDFIYFDSHHDYQHVLDEFSHLAPNMTGDCILAFHDTILFPEVQRAVNELPVKQLTLPTSRGCGLTIATLI